MGLIENIFTVDQLHLFATGQNCLVNTRERSRAASLPLLVMSDLFVPRLRIGSLSHSRKISRAGSGCWKRVKQTG